MLRSGAGSYQRLSSDVEADEAEEMWPGREENEDGKEKKRKASFWKIKWGRAARALLGAALLAAVLLTRSNTWVQAESEDSGVVHETETMQKIMNEWFDPTVNADGIGLNDDQQEELEALERRDKRDQAAQESNQESDAFVEEEEAPFTPSEGNESRVGEGEQSEDFSSGPQSLQALSWTEYIDQSAQGPHEEDLKVARKWTAIAKETNLTKAALALEWNLDNTGSPKTLEECQDSTPGFRCPALRHCSVKQTHRTFYGGGEWRNDARGHRPRFHPHNCWLYNFNGREPWLQNNTARVAILLDGDHERSVFSKAASKFPHLLAHVVAGIPDSLDAEVQLAARITEAFHSSVAKLVADVDAQGQDQDQDQKKPELVLVTNWVAPPGTEASLARQIIRIAGLASPSADSEMQVLWSNIPYYSAEEVADTVSGNEEMHSNIKTRAGTDESGALVRRRQVQLWENPPSDGNPMLLISLREILKTPGKYVIFEVSSGASSDAKDPLLRGLTWLANNSYTIPMKALVQGWVPNLPLNADIVVWARSGYATAKAIKILRIHGYGNSRGLVVSRVTSTIKKDTPPSRSLKAGPVSLHGLDLFAPSLGLPEERPGSSAQLADFLADAVLNHLFRRELVWSATTGGDRHVCSARTACTSCTRTIATIPSERVDRYLITTYLYGRHTPHKVQLSERDRFWRGSWDSLVHDLDADVRLDNSSKSAAPQSPLREYLVHSGVAQLTGDEVRVEEGPDFEISQASGEMQGSVQLLSKSIKTAFNFPSWLPFSAARPSLWLGRKGAHSGLHCDAANQGSFVYHVLGRKRWVLFPPKTRSVMHGVSVGSMLWSQVQDPLRYHLNRAAEQSFPDFALTACESIDLTVESDELLFLPDMWWHADYNLQPSVMLHLFLSTQRLAPPRTLKQAADVAN